MPSAGFEPTIQASERPHTHALDRATTGIASYNKLQARNGSTILMINILEKCHAIFTWSTTWDGKCWWK